MNNKILISSDSTCDLSPELLERYNIKTVPLGVNLGDKTFFDGVDITPDEIYAHHEKTGELPKTTAANVGDLIDYFKPLSEENKAVIHLSLSSDFSSTYNNACLAASEYDNIFVVDSRNLSTGNGLLVIAAKEMAESGMEAKKIVEKLNEMALCVDASFVIDNLEYLHKGGRCSALAALGANLLKLKPCIQVKNGSMGVCKKYRGRYMQTLEEYAADRFADLSDIDPDRVFITHAGCDDEIVNGVYKLVEKTGHFKEIIVSRAGCTISSHCGKDTLGILYFRKTPLE